MSEMIERVAQAMHERARGAPEDHGDCDLPPFEELEDWQVAGALDMARVAIEAMREPTSEMIEAGMDADTREWRRSLGDRLPTAEECQANDWRAMIDEALKEPPNEAWRRQHARGK